MTSAPAGRCGLTPRHRTRRAPLLPLSITCLLYKMFYMSMSVSMQVTEARTAVSVPGCRWCSDGENPGGLIEQPTESERPSRTAFSRGFENGCNYTPPPHPCRTEKKQAAAILFAIVYLPCCSLYIQQPTATYICTYTPMHI